MTLSKRFFVWLSGHSPSNLGEATPHDVDTLAKLGSAVLVATALAMFNWSVAGWVFTEGMHPAARIAIAIAAAAFAAAVVLVFDRTTLYFLDTVDDGKLWLVWLYGGFRVVLILVAGSLTAQAVMPVLMHSELELHGLRERERATDEREHALRSRYQSERLADNARIAANELKAAQDKLLSLPPAIEKPLLAARACWADHAQQRAEMLASGYEEHELRIPLAPLAARCTHQQREAQRGQEQYLAQARVEVNRARKADAAARQARQETELLIAKKAGEAEEIEARAITPRSSTLLWSLITHDRGAALKWLGLSFFQLAFELFPLLLKARLGRTAQGAQIAAERRLRRAATEAQRDEGLNHLHAVSTMASMSKEVMESVAKEAAVRGRFATVFAHQLRAQAPLEAVRATLDACASRSIDITAFMAQNPQYAEFAHASMTQAVKAAMEQAASPIREELKTKTKRTRKQKMGFV